MACALFSIRPKKVEQPHLFLMTSTQDNYVKANLAVDAIPLGPPLCVNSVHPTLDSFVIFHSLHACKLSMVTLQFVHVISL